MDSEGEPCALPAETENELVRVGQEALTNAIRHAGAGRIRVCLRYFPDKVTLCVADDGRGIPGNARGLGLQGMEERMRRLRGALRITANGSAGTTVTASLPLTS